MALYGAGSCANGLLIMDSTEIQNKLPNPKLKYVKFLSWCDQQIDPDFGDGSSASTHATEYMIHENGREYVMTTDEGSALGGSACPAQHTFSRLIDISDEQNPVVVATMKPDSSKPAENDFTRPDPRFDSENCFWYTGWNQGGLVSLEMTNPEYNACMRKTVKAKGKILDPNKGKKKVDFNVVAKRSNGGRGAIEG